MTGDGPPASGHPGPDAVPELLASDEDRDRVIETLRDAAGEGRLSGAELGERLDAALTARKTTELDALTVDLPEVGTTEARAKDIVRLDYQGGNATRRGNWVVPKRMEIRAVGGSVILDFTDAVISGPKLPIQTEVRGGRLVLVTKPGIAVDTDGVKVHGGKVTVRPEHGWKGPVALTVEVTGEVRGGRLVARPPRRNFRQWMLHRPGPYSRSAGE